MRAVCVHEYGHAIFHLNLMKRSASYKNFIDKMAQKPQVYSVEKIDKLFIDAYSELFADIVAVVTTQDLDIMWKAAKEDGVENSGKERSFSLFHKLEGWESIAPYYLLAPTKTYLGKNQMKNLANLKNTDFLSKLLDVLIQAIDQTRKDFIVQYNENPSKELYEYEIDAVKINRNLIRLLEDSLVF